MCEWYVNHAFRLKVDKVQTQIKKSISYSDFKYLNLVNPVFDIGLFLYLLKTSENLWFSDVSRGYSVFFWYIQGE